MHNNIDKILEDIDTALEENALPKAAPTQLMLNSPPACIPITSLHVSSLSNGIIDEIFHDVISQIDETIKYLHLFPGPGIRYVVSLPKGFYFSLACTECEFMHYDRDCPLIIANNHANHYSHVLDLRIHAGERKIAIVRIDIPEKLNFFEETLKSVDRIIYVLYDSVSSFFKKRFSGS